MRLRTSTIAVPSLLLLGFTAAFTIFWEVRTTTLQNRRSSFELEASQRAGSIVEQLQSDFADLDALRRLFEGSEVVDSDEFQLFVEPILKKESAQQVLWVPRVPREGLQAFEESVRLSGFSGFVLHERDPQGESVPLGERDEYFILKYSLPGEAGKVKQGYDLGSDVALLNAMRQAGASAKPAILHRGLFLDSLPDSQSPSRPGASRDPSPAVVFVPVYGNRDPGAASGKETLQGFVVGVYDFGETIAHLIEETPPLGLPTELVDLESTPPEEKIFIHKPRMGTTTDIADDLRFDREFTYADRRHRVSVRAGTGFLQRHPVHWTYTILGMGCLCTCLAALLIQLQLAGRRRAETLVARRTGELRANERMLNAHVKALRLMIHEVDECDEHFSEALRVLGEVTGSDIVFVCDLRDAPRMHDLSTYWTRCNETDTQQALEACRAFLSSTEHEAHALRNGESVRMRKAAFPERFSQSPEPKCVRSLLAVPFKTDGRLGGVLAFMSLEQELTFVESEVRILESSASSIGLTLKRHEVERQLRTLAERLRLATAAADVGIWDWDLAEDRLVWDRRLADMHGIDLPPEREFVAQWLQRVHPDDVGSLMEQARHAAGVSGSLDAEYRIVRPTGELRYVRSMATVSRDETGQPIRMTGVIWDVTQRKRAEEQQRESERFIRAVLDGVPAHICVLDTSGKILAVNHAWHGLARLMGVPPKSVSEGAEFLHVVRDVYRVEETYVPALEEGLSSLMKGERDGSIVEYQCRVRSAVHWFIAKMLPIPQSHPPRYLIVNEDVTILKNAIEERIELERRVLHTQKLESLGVLAGGIAHDFNNLLMVILGNLDIASHDIPPGSPPATCVSEATQAARRAADLSRQMLAYTGKGRFIVHPVDLNALVEEIAQLLQVSISKTVVLELGLAPQLPRILVDSAQVQQIVMNLITNASEAIGDKVGHIRIATGVEECDDKLLSKSCVSEQPPSGRFVYLDVRDSGCGMDRETRQRLFDPFFTTKFTGRGLGMAAVLGIVRGHSGAILVDSEPGKGTAIRVLFPEMKQGETPGVKDEPQAMAAGTAPNLERLGGTILVVDDEAAVRNLCFAMLSRLGLNTLIASDGEEAIRVYDEHGGKIDGVLLDLTMPKLDGMAVAAEIRRRWPDAKIVLSSGYSEEEVSSRFATEGLQGFIQKPYTLRVLREAIERILGESET